MGAPRAALNAATQSVGFTAKLVTVQSISADGTQAVCVDRLSTQTTVNMLVQRSKGPLPQAGETWLLTQDLGMWAFAAIVATSTGQFIGGPPGGVTTGQRITVSSSSPPGPAAGDVWVNGSSGNAIYWWDGKAWTPAQLGTQALADGAVTAAKIADGTITSAQIAPDAGITATQVAFSATDIGGTQVITGTDEPPEPSAGTLWVNPDQDNQLNSWENGTWAPVQFGPAAIQPASLTSAQLAEDAAIAPGQVSFTARDIGGITTSIEAAEPASPQEGDLWYDASDDYALKQWSGTAWVPYQFGTQAIAAGSVTAALIAANTITAAQIAAGTITAAQIQAGTLTSALIGNLGSVLNPNPFMAGGSSAGWAGKNGTVAVVSGAGLPSGAPYAYALQFTCTGGTSAGADESGGWFPVVPGQQYLLTAWVNTPGTGVYISLIWQLNGSYVTYSSQTFTVTPNTWTQVVAIFTAPASGVNQGFIEINAGIAAGDVVYIQGAMAFAQIPGGLIAAGTITANQIAAGTITASQIAAGTITASQIAAGTLTAAIIGNLGLCLNKNPFFSGGSSAGWTVSGTGNASAVVAASTVAGAPLPGYAARATYVTAGASADKFNGSSDQFGVVVGSRYAAAAWVYSTVAITVNFGFEFRNSSNSPFSTLTAATSIPAATWALVSTVQTAPAGAVTGDLTFWTSAATVLYVQGAQAFPQVPGIVDATTIMGASLVLTGAAGELLAYSGTPASGNLGASVSPAAGTDGEANPYVSGVAVYGEGSSKAYAALTVSPTDNGTLAVVTTATGVPNESAPAAFYSFAEGSGATEQVTTWLAGPKASFDNAYAAIAFQSSSGTPGSGSGNYRGYLISNNGTTEEVVFQWNQAGLVLNNPYQVGSPNSDLIGYGPPLAITDSANRAVSANNTWAQISQSIGVPAGDPKAGTLYRCTMLGSFSLGSAHPNITFSVSGFNVTQVAQCTLNGSDLGTGGGSVVIECWIQVISIGTSGTANFMIRASATGAGGYNDITVGVANEQVCNTAGGFGMLVYGSMPTESDGSVLRTFSNTWERIGP